MASEIRVNKIANRAGLSTVEYTDTGIIVSGIVTCTEISGLNALNIAGVSTFASPLDINGDIDVDGHTNLDNLSVAGVSTFSSNITLNGGLVASNNISAAQILVGSGVTIEANQVATGQATFTGIVTASAFKLSDGSNVGGIESDAQRNTVGGTNAGDSFSGTSATDNVCLGYNAGTAIDECDANVAIGAYALESVTGNRSGCVAIGYEAAKSYNNDGLTTGPIAIGYQALKTGGKGVQVAIGYKALTSCNTSGYWNVAVGSDSLRNTSSGKMNIALGTQALYTITTAEKNTALGHYAAAYLNSGNNNINIGYQAYPSNNNISNEITLGNGDVSHFRIPGIGVSFGRSGATIAGVVTATSFSGDGSNLSNLPASAPVGGASTNTVFFENDIAVAVNYQITTNKNAMSAGPIAINAGIAVTVPSGCSWTIV